VYVSRIAAAAQDLAAGSEAGPGMIAIKAQVVEFSGSAIQGQQPG